MSTGKITIGYYAKVEGVNQFYETVLPHYHDQVYTDTMIVVIDGYQGSLRIPTPLNNAVHALIVDARVLATAALAFDDSEGKEIAAITMNDIAEVEKLIGVDKA